MSRYVILIEDENIEVVTGFDEGFEKFFLTIEDARTCTGEAGGYIFHNMDHHPGVGMTLEEVGITLERFGLTLPADLRRQLKEDARRCGVSTPDVVTTAQDFSSQRSVRPPMNRFQRCTRVLSWQSAM